MAISQDRTCTKCKQTKSAIEFHKSSNNRSGLQPKCKDCRRAYREENADWINAKKKVYREINRERICADLRQRYAADKSYYNQRAKRWRERNADYKKQSDRRYYLENTERVKSVVRGRYKTHKHLWTIYTENRIARKKGARGSFTADQWQAKLIYFGYRCSLCHSSLENQEIHLEHRIPLSRGGSNWIANIAPACRRCNLRKSTKTEKEFKAHLLICPT
jgi:5-methylcytosine-specific restriction endonuclease McrA